MVNLSFGIYWMPVILSWTHINDVQLVWPALFENKIIKGLPELMIQQPVKVLKNSEELYTKDTIKLWSTDYIYNWVSLQRSSRVFPARRLTVHSYTHACITHTVNGEQTNTILPSLNSFSRRHTFLLTFILAKNSPDYTQIITIFYILLRHTLAHSWDAMCNVREKSVKR